MGLRIVPVTGRSFFVPSRRSKQPLARLIVLPPSCLRLYTKHFGKGGPPRPRKKGTTYRATGFLRRGSGNLIVAIGPAL